MTAQTAERLLNIFADVPSYMHDKAIKITNGT